MSHQRSDVERVSLASKSAAHHARAADLVERQRKLCAQLDAYFREVDEVRELLKQEGSIWAGPVFDPPLEAAHAEWVARGPRETRIEIDRVGPVPMMELEDGYPDTFA